jgi:hypothetical protein
MWYECEAVEESQEDIFLEEVGMVSPTGIGTRHEYRAKV